MMRGAAMILVTAALAACASAKSSTPAAGNAAPYMDVCQVSGPSVERLLLDSRLSGTTRSASFYSINGNKLIKLVSFADTWDKNVAGRTEGPPPEADHYMLQSGANMAGERILSAYELIFPMKTVGIGQQMVGEDLLRLRANGQLWKATCRQLDPASDEYRRYLARVSQ